MIPSRALRLVELIAETISIEFRISWRYILLFFLLFLPGLALFTLGSEQLTTDWLAGVRTSLHYSDSEFVALRDEGRLWLREQYPFFEKEEELLGVHDSISPTIGYPHLKQVAAFVTSESQQNTHIFWIVLGGLMIIVGGFACVASTLDLACAAFEDRPLEFKSALLLTFRRHVWRLIAMYVLYWFAILLVELVCSVIGAISAAAGTFLGNIFTILEIWVSLRLLVAVPALVCEERSPFRAITRSWQLTRGNVARILGVSIVAGILFFLGMMLVSVFTSPIYSSDFGLVGHLMRDRELSYAWLASTFPALIRATVGDFGLFAILLGPFLPVFATVLYYDLRTRHDGPLVYLD